MAKAKKGLGKAKTAKVRHLPVRTARGGAAAIKGGAALRLKWRQ